jgi:chromosome segregation ATPase
MMRVILKQGRIICNELLRMERDEDAEDEDEDEETLRQRKSEPSLGHEANRAETEALVADLLRLHSLNQELHAMETRAQVLSANLLQLQPTPPATEVDSDGVERRVATMRALNASAGEDVDRQQKELADLHESLSARRASARQLEYDVNVVEKEGRRLHKELEKVMSLRIPELSDADDDHGHVLRESQVIYGELKQLQQVTASAASHGRTLITASPESSSSGVSSGSEAPASPGRSTSTSFAPIRTCADEAAESNSDTGLGSLHSSTAGSADELETLV